MTVSPLQYSPADDSGFPTQSILCEESLYYLSEGKQVPQGHNSHFSSMFAYNNQIVAAEYYTACWFNSLFILTFRIVKNSHNFLEQASPCHLRVSGFIASQTELNIQKHKLHKRYHSF